MSSSPAVTRLAELKIRLGRLKKEAEAAVSNIKCFPTRGNSVVNYQESIQDVEHFLRSYPVAVSEIDVLVNSLVKVNCELEICLARQSDLCDMLQNYEIKEPVECDGEVCCTHKRICESCSKEKKTVSTNTDFSVLAQKTVRCVQFQKTIGTNTDIIVLAQKTIGTNMDMSVQAQKTTGTNTDISAQAQKTIGTNTDISAQAQKTIGTNTNTDFGTFARYIVGANIDKSELVQDTMNNAKEYTVDTICKIYHIVNEAILEMRHLQGDEPTQFWLQYYSDGELLSHLSEIKRKLNFGELRKVAATPAVGQFIIGYSGTVFRGYVLSNCNGKITALDIDRGIMKYVNDTDIWEIGDHMTQFPPQAILCKLCSIPDELHWCTYLSKLFENCLRKCNLVVTVKDIIPGVIPTFVIDVDAHDGSFLDVNMSEWINNYVIPVVRNMKSLGFFEIDENTVFEDIDPYIVLNKNACLDSSLLSQQNTDSVQEDANISIKVLENEPNARTVLKSDTISNCVDVNLEETVLSDDCEFISCSVSDSSEITSTGSISNDSFVLAKNLSDNFMNGKKYLPSVNVDDQVCQKHSDLSNSAILSLPIQPIFKSSIVQCCLEKDSILEMSFVQGSNPWSFILNYVPKQGIVDIKRKLAAKAEYGTLIPFPSIPEIGDFAIWKSGPECFRVRVTNVPAHDKRGIVLGIDIDSGDFKMINLKDLWLLEEEFSTPPAMAVQCALWNLPRNPFYWDINLENLFKAVLTRGRLNVHVKDVERHSSNWRHIVQIQVSADCVFDLSEWVMLFIFPNIEKIKQFSASPGVNEMVLNLDPAILFKEGSSEKLMRSCLPNIQKSRITSCKSSTSESEGSNLQIANLYSVLPSSNPRASQKDTFFGHVVENYEGREIFTESLNELRSNDTTLDFKKHQWVVKPATKYYAFLSYVLNPSEFYVHIVSVENSSIDDMHKELTNYCCFGSIHFRNKEQAKQLIVLGCAVNYKNQWCRGRIIDWLEDSSDDVEVFLVDYGIYAPVPFYSIQYLRSDFYKYPVYAQKCSLANISPPSNDGYWPECSLRGFWNVLNYQTVYEICIEKYLEVEETMNVFLLYDEDNVTECINDYLIDEGYAVPQKCGNDVNKPESYHKIVCPIFDSGMGEIVSDDESIDNYNTTCNKEILPYFDNNTAGLPDVGEQLSVVITDIVNIRSFWAVYDECHYRGRSQSTHAVLTELNKNIKSAVERGIVKPSKLLLAGSIVIARYDKDGSWYRARLLTSVDDDGYVEVFFVDYGNVDNVHKYYVRETKKEFCELPFLAMRFFIADFDVIKLNDPRGQENALVLLQNLLGRREVYLNVIRILNEDIIVKLFQGSRDIGSEMLNLYHGAVEKLRKN